MDEQKLGRNDRKSIEATNKLEPQNRFYTFFVQINRKCAKTANFSCILSALSKDIYKYSLRIFRKVAGSFSSISSMRRS